MGQFVRRLTGQTERARSQDTLTDLTVEGAVASQDDFLSQGTLTSQESDVASQDVAFQDVAFQDEASQDEASQDEASQEVTPRPQEEASSAHGAEWVLGRDLSPAGEFPGQEQDPRDADEQQPGRPSTDSRVWLALGAAVASVVAVVSAGLMLLSEQLASSIWPLALTIVALLVAGTALLGWWRKGTASPPSFEGEEALPS